MYYNEYYRPKSNKPKYILIAILIIIALIIVSVSGYLLFTKVIFADKSYEHLSEFVIEKEYKSKDGKIKEKYSYIEVPEKEIDVINLRDWSRNYVVPNINKFDKFIIKYKGDKEDRGIIFVAQDYINIDCKIIEHKDGKIEYEYSNDEYSIAFNGDVITKYIYNKEKEELWFYDWDPQTKKWGDPGKV